MRLQIPFYTKLTLVITSIAFVISLGFLSLALWSNGEYHREVTQRLHHDLAQYILDHLSKPLLTYDSETSDLVVHHETLNSIAMNTMMINPSVEVYLLDLNGNLLGHALPEASVDTQTLAVKPIQDFIESNNGALILGDNPRLPNQSSIFSASPVLIDNEPAGYLYVILASHEALSLRDQVDNSHILRLTLGAAFALALFFILSAFFSFYRITQPLKKLTHNVRSYRKSLLNTREDEFKKYDEVDELSHSFELMQQRIQQQFDLLSESDRLRRELISNVSHDLRTPLASMQGYLETLLLKYDKMNDDERRQCVSISYRHSRQLAKLVSQLFELSKLDSGRVEPEFEVFSITELLFDVKQDYDVIANKKGIQLNVIAPDNPMLVNADISLIQRVLQNLIDNALRHTPTEGEVSIELTTDEDLVYVSVQDNGAGISAAEMPYIFQRFYQSDTPQKHQGAGLGLSIVKKILDLHGAIINVYSEPASGTRFVFQLSASS